MKYKTILETDKSPKHTRKPFSTFCVIFICLNYLEASVVKCVCNVDPKFDSRLRLKIKMFLSVDNLNVSFCIL